MRSYVLCLLLLAWASAARAQTAQEMMTIPIAGGGYCTLFAKATRSCVITEDKKSRKASAHCTGSISANGDYGTYILSGTSAPSSGKPPLRSDETPLVKCFPGPHIEWRGCSIRGGPGKDTAKYSVVCGSCDSDGTNCRTHRGTLTIIRSRESKRASM
jgi:hypothetical protein